MTGNDRNNTYLIMVMTGGWFIDVLPSGKRLHNYGKIHHVSWENSLFQWPFSIAMLVYQRVHGFMDDFDGL